MSGGLRLETMRSLMPAEVDHRTDPEGWARTLGVSREAVDLYLASDVVDLHVDSFIWTRTIGYDLRRRHRPSPFGGRWLSQVDLPRLREARVSGALWSITTSPWRSAPGRARAFARNLDELRRLFESVPDDVALVRDVAGYRAAKATGKHAAFVAIQGGNALDDETAIGLLDDGAVVAVTLVHLSTSSLGASSAPGPGAGRGLSEAGRRFVEALDERRVFVDLAHVSRRGFFDAVAVHDKSRPLLVSHTGVSGVTPSRRNVDDEQLRAVAESGGVVGIIFHGGYLGANHWSGGTTEVIVDHVAHACDTIGDDHVALGSDWDGAIITPRDMRTCLELPRLVQRMLDRGFSETRVRKVLGASFLRALSQLRG